MAPYANNCIRLPYFLYFSFYLYIFLIDQQTTSLILMWLELNLTVFGMRWHSTARCTSCKFYSYWQCQKFCLMIYSYSFRFINMNRITSGKIKKKKEKKKMWLLPCRFRGVCHRDSRRIAKKVAAKKYSITKSTLEFWLSSQFSKYSMKPKPVLSEDEQLLAYWITAAPKKYFLRWC